MPDGGHHLTVGESPVRVARLEPLPQLIGGHEDPLAVCPFLQLEDIVLDSLEGGGGDGRRHRVPGELASQALHQLVEPFALQRAGADVSPAGAVLPAEGIDLLLCGDRVAAVGSRADEDGRTRPLSSVAQRLQPVLRAAEGLLAVAGIEQHERSIGVIQKQRIDQPVVRLPGEVPQHRLTLRAIGALAAELIEHPELLPVGGGMVPELAVREPVAEAGLADSAVTHEHDLCGRVRQGLPEGRFGQEHIAVQVPYPDRFLPLVGNRESGAAGVEGKRPISPLCLSI